ncbi:hypothetical protein RJ55_05645 [Drechmeria coniospora]|nr:hypothetical protein RJ55_05645 [Drechmeria coniospora]
MRFDLALLALAAQSVQVFSNPAEAQEESQVETMAESHTLELKSFPQDKPVVAAWRHDRGGRGGGGRGRGGGGRGGGGRGGRHDPYPRPYPWPRYYACDYPCQGYSCYGSYPVCRWYTYPGYATQCYCSAT